MFKTEKMFKIEMTFLIPEDKVKFKKAALVVNESCEGFSGKQVYPDIPELIDGTVYNTLTEKQQEAFWLVEGEHLFEHEHWSEITDEFLLPRSCST